MSNPKETERKKQCKSIIPILPVVEIELNYLIRILNKLIWKI